MGATKEYYLRLTEQAYEELSTDEKMYLSNLGMQVKQLPPQKALEDPNYQKLKKMRRDAYEAEQKYLFELNHKKQ